MTVTKEQNDFMILRRKIRKQLRRCLMSQEQKEQRRTFLRLQNGHAISLKEQDLVNALHLATLE